MIIVFVINLPFGHLRSKYTKFSVKWMVATHLPIPLVFLLRTLSGLNWTIIPFVILADIAGQIVGEKLSDIVGKQFHGVTNR